jgi:transcriptional regulator with XRE-family HTH domain
LTQSDLATRIGIQQSDLCRMENGQYRVGLETLVKILRECGITFSEFFQEEPTGELNHEEAGLIQRFRRLSGPGRNQLLHFVRFLCDDSPETIQDEAVSEMEALFPPLDTGRRDT